MSDKESRPTYEVGYKKTPKKNQFKPGQSGNPKGRPKGAKNLATIVGNAIAEKVVITGNGKRKTVSKLELAITQLVNKAAGGDQRAMQQLLPLVQLIEGRAEAETKTTSSVAEADQLVMAGIRARFRQNLQESPTMPAADVMANPEAGNE